MNTKVSPQELKNAYTDSPELNPNLFLGSLQLFFWLLFHPSAWRNHVKRIDSTLRPDFALGELHSQLWRDSILHRTLITGNIVLPFLMGLGALVILSLSDLQGYEAFGVVGGVAGVIIGAVVVGVAFAGIGAMVFGVAIAIVGAVALGIAFVGFGIIEFSIAAVAVLFGLASGVTGGVALNVVRQSRSQVSISRQISGSFAGIIIGIVLGFVALIAAAASLGGDIGLGIGALTVSLWDDIIVQTEATTVGVRAELASGVVFAIVAAVAIGIRKQQWKSGVVFGLVFGMSFAVVVFVAGAVENALVGVGEIGYGVAIGGRIGLAFGVAYSVVFALPYTIAERVAGPVAGAVAGALASGSWALLFLQQDNATVSVAILWSQGLFGVVSGLTFSWWLPLILYPIEVVWNLMLYRGDGLHNAGSPSLLRRNAAFWDEHQRLRLFGLEEHLVLILEQSPNEGQRAIDYLATSSQQWAAQEAQIELDARALERCTTVEAISHAHHGSAAGELEGPASALLRSFSRISGDVEASLQQESAYNQRLALSAVEDHLDGLLRELTRSSESYAVRFRPIAKMWRQTIADCVRELAEEAELRQEIDSPYVIGVPLTEQQEIFVGRTDVSARIEQLLLDRRRPPLLLYGQRRMGKTSLLNNLGRLLPSTIVPLFVDLQGRTSQAKDETGFLYNLTRTMIDSARESRGLDLPDVPREAFATDPFTCFYEWMDELERTLEENTVLLMLDEFEALDSAIKRGRFDEESILGSLRHLIQHRSRFKVLLAGSHTLDEFQRWASYLINVQVVHLSYLAEKEARQLIEQPVPDFSLRYDPEASRRVLTLTHCHPYLVQLLCAEIVALKNEQAPSTRRRARLEDVDAAVPEALSSGSFFFGDIERNQVSAAGRRVLRFLASHGEDGVVTRGHLAQHIGSPVALEQTLGVLEERELIERTEEGYRFQVELIRRWFAQR